MPVTSYPFLAVARQFNEDYGDVLLYADVLRRRRARGRATYYNPHEEAAIRRITTVAAIAVGRALDREELRRDEEVRRGLSD